MTTASELGAALARARGSAGTPRPISFRRLSRLLDREVGDLAPDAETLRVWHGPKGTAPEKVDLEVLATLADIYAVDVCEFHPIVAERVERTTSLFDRSSNRRSAVRTGSRCSSRTDTLTSAAA